MILTSTLASKVAPRACLFILGDLQKRQCLLKAKFLFNFPVPVTLKRFLTALLVFILGILIPFKNQLSWIYAIRQACQLALNETVQRALYNQVFQIASIFLTAQTNNPRRFCRGLLISLKKR